jgi:lysophospholipase L1-like esterase
MWFKKFLTILIGVVISIGLCEIVLRIYNPFQSRVRGNEIILKSNYKRQVMIDPPVKGLDASVKYSTNSLGFRGPEPPKQWDEATTIITIGGSTTECSLLSDDSTWTAHLYSKLKASNPGVWMNNAGLDGCSSYGHIILMRDYIVNLKPDYALFLVGINDVVKMSFQNEDGFLIKRNESFWRTMLKKSELFTTISNLMEAMKSQKANVAHGNDPYDYKNMDLNKGDSIYRAGIQQQLTKMLPAYTDRISEIVKQCRQADIKPVFVTQPKFDDTLSFSWQVMQQYNDALIAFCGKESIPVIDLGQLMPREEALYYDQIHFTNRGAAKIGDILYPEMQKILQQSKK